VAGERIIVWLTPRSNPWRAWWTSDFRAYVYVVLMVVIGSTAEAAAKFAVRDLPVALVPVLRFGLAGLCLLPVLWRPGVLTRFGSSRGQTCNYKISGDDTFRSSVTAV